MLEPGRQADVRRFLRHFSRTLWFVFLTVQSVLFAWPVLDAHWRPVPQDFISFWSAGKFILAGHPAMVYDSLRLHAVQVAAVGHEFPGYFVFIYPPSVFTAVTAGLALLPFALAFAVWTLGTGAAYAAVARQLFRSRAGLWLFGAAPAVLYCFVIGQTGLCTAALFGGFLLALKERPIVSGLLVAALTFKPQFGLIVPVALIAGGHWRTLAAAALATVAELAAWTVVDPGVIAAFLHVLGRANYLFLTLGSTGWFKMQSLYALLRLFAVGAGPAMAVQIALAATAAAVVWTVWRSPRSFVLKAAVLVVAAVAATPYVYIYDLPALTVAVGFLYRDRPFDRFESVVVGAAYAFIAAYPVLALPTGLFAQVFIWLLIARRLNSSVEAADALSQSGCGANQVCGA